MAASSSVHAPERSKVEQIVVEFFAKSLHIILESRIPALGADSDYLGSSASSSTSGSKTRDRWFNLALGDCTTALENFEPWRRSFSDPMVVDILLDNSKFAERKSATPRFSPSEPSHWAKGSPQIKGLLSISENKATVLERWTVQFEQRRRSSALSPPLRTGSGSKPLTGNDAVRLKPGEAQVDNREDWARSQKTRNDDSAARGGVPLPAHVTEVSAVYKRTVVMLRSLYSTCRLLPAYRMFRMSSLPTNCCDFSLSYRVLSSAAPFPEHESRDMSMYRLTPVETAFGRMCLSVQYRIKTAVVALEVVPSILPCIIPDYVGSPTTDPLKRFTGEPHSLPARGESIGHGIHLVSVPSSLQNSPPFAGLGRRHSWGGRINQMQPVLQPPSSPSYRISRSPSPSYPFHPSPPYTSSPHSPFSQKQQYSDLSFSPLSSPHSSTDRHPGISTKASQPISIDSRCSPPFSPSPSPSPPTSYRGSQPVSIPKPSQSRGSKLSVGDPYHRGKNLLPPLSPSAKKAGILLRSSSESPRYSGQPGLPAHQSRSFESPSQLHMLHGDPGRQVWMEKGSVACAAENLPFGQTTLSRSSSKTALGDDGEDDDFPCPFAVDDVDADEKKARSEPLESSSSLGGTAQRSAAIGALIGILKSAPPLRHLSEAIGTALEPSLMFESEEKELQDRSPQAQYAESRTSSLEHPPNSPNGKMAAEALEELLLYKNLRDLILMHGEDKEHLK